jgi:hypothetical protein
MLPSKLQRDLCSTILDSGCIGSAEEYVRTFYGKGVTDLTVCEAEMIIRVLKKEDSGEEQRSGNREGSGSSIGGGMQGNESG